MTDREAMEYLQQMWDDSHERSEEACKTRMALLTAVVFMQKHLNTTEKPFRNPSVGRKEDKWAKILSERLKALNGRFFDLEQAVEKLSVDLDILRDRFDSHIWERHDED